MMADVAIHGVDEVKLLCSLHEVVVSYVIEKKKKKKKKKFAVETERLGGSTAFILIKTQNHEIKKHSEWVLKKHSTNVEKVFVI